MKNSLGVFSIYTLSDPESFCVFYVGCTTHPASRLKQHISESQHPFAYGKKASKKQLAIRSILRSKRTPVLTTVDRAEFPECRMRESLWMTHFRTINPKLTNIRG